MPSAPLTDPGGRFSRTGLFRSTHARMRQRLLARHAQCMPSPLWPAGRFASLDPSFLRSWLPVWAALTCWPLYPIRGLRLASGYYYYMSQSDSRSASRRFFGLRLPSCLALAVSAAGTLRVSFVPCVSFRARHALRPRQALLVLTFYGRFGFGFRQQDAVSTCV